MERVVSALRSAALDAHEGTFLGSEVSLTAEFGVSAPTLRQAARLLEHEQVIKVRRGVSGGYYACRPSLDAIARVAATYLRGNPGSLDDVMTVMRPLTAVVVDQVIRNEQAAAMLHVIATTSTEDPQPEAFVEEESRFLALLIGAVENAPLQLILSVFYGLGALLPRPPLVFDARLAAQIRSVRADLACALVAKDSELAVARMLEHQQLLARRRAPPTPGGPPCHRQ